MAVQLPVTGALVDVVAGAEIVTGQVTQQRAGSVVVELPVEPVATEPLRLYWSAPGGVHTVLARVAMRWPVRTGVRWQLLPAGSAERSNRRDAVRAPLRLKLQVVDRRGGTVFRAAPPTSARPACAVAWSPVRTPPSRAPRSTRRCCCCAAPCSRPRAPCRP